jgi:hypothetical protein
MDSRHQKEFSEYRALLNDTEQKAQEDFDKTVLALSGGALGLSFAFTKDVVGPGNMVHTVWLFGAWLGWGLSSTAVLISFYFSQLALRKAIYQLDSGKLSEERAGGFYDRATAGLNLAGLVLFVVGMATMLIFLRFNLKDHMNTPEKATESLDEGRRVPVFPADKMQSDFAGRLVPTPPSTVTSSPEESPANAPQVTEIPHSPTPTQSTDEETK